MKQIVKSMAQKVNLAAFKGEVANGLCDGIPIALGYFAVAFSLGIIAKKAGIMAWLGFVSSFFTRASAGEYGVYTLVAANAAYVEVVAMSLVVNLRYMLMSAALSQKIKPNTSWFHRILMACCITDEVFGISITHKGYTPPAYTYAAALVSTLCWASGCAALWHVYRGHHAAGQRRPQCALCRGGQLRFERPLRCGACCGPMECRYAHHRAHRAYFFNRRMA